jgi:hypothetical protein
MVVLGNKSDVEKDRHQVAEATARSMCEKHGIPHFLVSAKEGTNVDQAFLSVVKAALRRPAADVPIPDTLDLTVTAPPKEDGCPC